MHLLLCLIVTKIAPPQITNTGDTMPTEFTTPCKVVNYPHNGLEWFVVWEDECGERHSKAFKKKKQAVKFSETL